MEWIKGLQEVVPWLTNLPLPPKLIVSGLIVGAGAFLLALIWTPLPPPPETAVKAILGECYRRALFTRTHAQINIDAMFASIEKCRTAIQMNIPNIHRNDLQDTAANLLGIVEQIERRNPIRGVEDIDVINDLKKNALHSFKELAKATNGSYPLPKRGELGEAAYFTQEEADAPPSKHELRIE